MNRKQAICIAISIALVAFVWIAMRGNRMGADERRDELVAPLLNARQVTLAIDTDAGDTQTDWTSRNLSTPERNLLIDCLDDATHDKGETKWVVVGTITLTDAAGKNSKWLLFHLSQSEMGFRTSPDRYWRGVRRACIAELAANKAM